MPAAPACTRSFQLHCSAPHPTPAPQHHAEHTPPTEGGGRGRVRLGSGGGAHLLPGGQPDAPRRAAHGAAPAGELASPAGKHSGRRIVACERCGRCCQRCQVIGRVQGWGGLALSGPSWLGGRAPAPAVVQSFADVKPKPHFVQTRLSDCCVDDRVHHPIPALPLKTATPARACDRGTASMAYQGVADRATCAAQLALSLGVCLFGAFTSHSGFPKPRPARPRAGPPDRRPQQQQLSGHPTRRRCVCPEFQRSPSRPTPPPPTHPLPACPPAGPHFGRARPRPPR